jgi:hypothetical protein
MAEQTDDGANDLDGWPLPSVEVLRELEPPAVVWSEPDAARWPTRLPARG